MREWLTVIVVLLIIGILLDGWRRMRQSRQGALKMSLSMHQGIEKEDLEEYGSELPNGGARVVAQRNERDIEVMNRNLRDSLGAGRTTAGFKPKKPTPKAPVTPPAPPPEQVSLNLEESVPMLMEVDNTPTEAEPLVGEPEVGDSEVDNYEVDNYEVGDSEVDNSEVGDSIEDWEFKSTTEPTVGDARIEPSLSQTPDPVVDDPQPEVRLDAAEEVFVINVMAPQGQRFAGQALLDVILECGLRYGDMQIFHRHLDARGEGPVLFSMANMVKPGVFDLNTMAQFETPGVSLFMTLPLAADSRKAFDLMVSTAEAICERLGGDLKDENRSVMTKQTMDHCRQRISDFERKQLFKG